MTGNGLSWAVFQLRQTIQDRSWDSKPIWPRNVFDGAA